MSGGVAAKAVERKEQKYASLPAGHLFIPVTVNTWELSAHAHWITAQSGEQRSRVFLLQRLSIAVQRENSISVMRGLVYD